MKATTSAYGSDVNTWPSAVIMILTERELFHRLMRLLGLLGGVLVTMSALASAVLLARGDLIAAVLGRTAQ